MRLRTLGGLTLEGTSFSRPKPLLLLSYLTLEGAKERRFLSELFWQNAANPRNSLAMAISQLRRSAPGALEADESRAWATIECDAAELLSTLEQDRELAAVELYGGDFLSGVDLNGFGAEVEDWVYGTREFLASQVQESLVSLAEQDAAKGLFVEAARRTEAAHELGSSIADPELLLRLHTLLLASGSLRAVAVQREAEDFDLPLARSAEEARAALAEVATQERAAASSLPVRSTTFVGREQELEELMQLLSQDDFRMITLTGLGGSGKTRLALQLAQRLVAEGAFPDGVFFVPLEVVTSISGIPFAIAEAVGLNLSGNRGQLEPFERVLGHLEDKNLLLILDNYEHLLDGSYVVRELLGSCPELKVLVTSRERLRLRSESVFPLSGLLASSPGEVALGAAGDSVRLFVQRAKSANLGFRLTPENRADVLRVCELVGGSPLAIELAASWVQLLSPAEIAEEITTSLDFLATSIRDVTDRHQSVRATFEHSWTILSPAERAVLMALSVFAGGFRREAAAVVAGASIPVLASLVDKSLLSVLLGGRYTLHPLIVQFARGKLSELPEEHGETVERHARYYLGLLTRTEQGIWADRAAMNAVMTPEWENLVAAWRWAVAQRRTEELKHCFVVIGHYCLTLGRFEEKHALFRAVIEAFDEHNPVHHAVLGAALMGQADPSVPNDEQIRLLRRGADLLRPLDEKLSALPQGLLSLSSSFFDEGLYQEAEECLQEAIALSRRWDYDGLVAVGLQVMAKIETIQGEDEKAEALLKEAREIHRRMGNFGGLWFNLEVHAGTLLDAGRAREAQAVYEEAIPLFDSHLEDTSYPRAGHLIRRGEIACELGSYEEARASCLEALHLAQDKGFKGVEVRSLMQLGRVAMALGDEGEGVEFLKRSLRLAVSEQMTALAVDCLVYFAEILVSRGELEKAAKALGLVNHHPASTPRGKSRAQELLGENPSMSLPEGAGVIREGSDGRLLEGVVAELLGVV